MNLNVSLTLPLFQFLVGGSDRVKKHHFVGIAVGSSAGGAIATVVILAFDGAGIVNLLVGTSVY
jgi:hypothetical protein